MDVKKIEVVEPIEVSPLEKILLEPLMSHIVALVRKHTGYSVDELKVRSRKRHLVVARQLNMYFMKRHTRFSLAVIGSIFNRDHATVLHAQKTIDDLIETDKRIRNLFKIIEDEVDTYKNIDKTTRYSVFQDLLKSTDLDDAQKKEWIEKYINSV